MVFHAKDDVKVAIWASLHASLAESAETDSGFVFDPCRNFGFNGFLLNHPSFAFALAAGIADDAPGTLARGAGTRDAEEPLLISYLSAPFTSATGCRCLATGAS